MLARYCCSAYTSMIMLFFLKSVSNNSKRVRTWDSILKGVDTSGYQHALSFFGAGSSHEEDSASD